jgi:hypothetical protein
MMIVLGGSSKSFTAREYHTFYDPNRHTVAVVPFRNETRTRGAGLLAAEDLAAALRSRWRTHESCGGDDPIDGRKDDEESG